MEDKNRKRRNSGNSFDWEEYDKLTSRISSQSTAPSANTGSSYEKEKDDESYVNARQNTAERRRKMAKRMQKREKKKKNKKLRRKIRLIVFSALLVLIIILTGISIGMYGAVSNEISGMQIQNLAKNTSSSVYYEDAKGQTQEYEKIQSGTNRIWVDSTKISRNMKDAIVSIEDERFYQHNGIDLKRTFGATAKFVLSKFGFGSSDYGGSTITQQVIKNITNEKDKSPTRKIKEMMRAIALEHQLSKDDILTMYLNIVYFSQNSYGIEAASHVYFGKSASELNLPEAALIAGITQYPSEFDPYVHPDKSIEKRNLVLSKMLELGKITQDQYNSAVGTKLVLNNSYKNEQQQITSYFTDQVINDVINDLMNQKGYSSDFATQQVYNGGLKIYATVDKNIQGIAEDVFSNMANFPTTGKGGQSAMIIMDPYTGKIKAIIGGLGEKTDVRGWNRATQSRRQPGSSIKPLSVYSPALDLGKITEATIVKDEKITIGNDNWKPKNSYNDFLGDMNVKEAVARSANIPAVKVLDMVGLSSSYSYLQNKFHISTLDEGDKNYSSLSLGGLTNGISIEEMCAAYSCFVNSGKYTAPYTYTQVVDSTGKVVLQNNSNSVQAISAATAYITSDMLYDVVNTSVGTGKAAKLTDMPTYGKTGTTDDDFDKWFVGFTPYYVAAVWYGFDTPASISAAGVSGNPSVTAWKLVMSKVHASLSAKTLTKPSNVVEEDICTYTGKIASDSCPSTKAYFIDGKQPTSYCNAAHSSHRSSGSSSSGSGSGTSGSGSSGSSGSSSGSKASGSSGSSESSSSGSQSSGSSSSGSKASGSSGSSGSTGSSSGSSSAGSSSGSKSSGSSSSGSSSAGSSSSGSSSGSSSSGSSAGSSGSGSGSGASSGGDSSGGTKTKSLE